MRLKQLADELEVALSGITEGINQGHATVSTDSAIPMDELTILRRQRTRLQHNLLTVEAQLATFIDPRSAPPDTQEARRRLQEEITRIEHRIAQLRDTTEQS
jgi:hypothetical protein